MEVGLALTANGLVAKDVRVLGVSGTATQYQLSSFMSIQSVEKSDTIRAR